MKKDYYDILGVNKSTSADDIKKAYRKLAMQYHPDRNPGDKNAEEKFKEAAEAYDVLSNPEKKAKYDRFGHQGMSGSGGFGGGGSMNMEDIFSNFGDIFGEGSPFESFFGNRRSSGRHRGTPGNNLKIKVKLTLQEIANGVKKTIKVKKQVECKVCNGSGAKDNNSVGACKTCGGSGVVRRVTQTFLGQMQTQTTCNTCNGSGQSITSLCNSCQGEGRVMGEETIIIDIPAGANPDIQFSMNNKGNAGKQGGPSGDLLINIEEIPHNDLKREGNHVIYDLFINFADAALGCSLEVPTLNGKAKIKIDAGTQAGKVLKLKGKGFPSLNTYDRGDQLIYVNVWTPKKLNSEETALLEKLRNAPNFKPQPDKDGKSFFDKVRDMFG